MIEKLKNRIIEASDFDQRHMLRPLLLFRGGQSEGRIRSLWNLLVTMKDLDVPSVTEAVKLAKVEDYRHLCGVHANPVNSNFNSILSRVVAHRKVADLVPGLWEYSRHLGNSSGATLFQLDPIAEYALRVRSDRDWRLTPAHLREVKLRPRKIVVPKVVLPEMYPYISGIPTSDHDMLLAVDAIVPRGLPNSMRGDVCQDMIVAVLSGEASLDNLKDDLKKYMSQFWKMFPTKYGHLSLDGCIPGTDLRFGDSISSHQRLA